MKIIISDTTALITFAKSDILCVRIENYRQDFISFDHAHYCFELVKKNGLRINEKLEDIFYMKLKEIKS